MTRKPLSRSKGQGHQAALLSTLTHFSLTRKAAAAVSLGTYCYVSSAQRRATGGGEGWGHIVSPRAQLVMILVTFGESLSVTEILAGE